MRARLLLTCALALCPVAAQTTKTIDLSTKNVRKKFCVIFAARGGSATGHAFVLWGSEDNVRQRSTIKAYGLYPENEKDACSSAIRRVPGAVVDESTNHGIANITDELIVKVDESDFKRLLKVARSWQCKREFALLSSDCVEFIRAIGDSLGLDMPHRTLLRWTPRAYVRALLAGVSSGTVHLAEGDYEGSLMNGRPMGHGVLVGTDRSRIEATFWGADNYVVAKYERRMLVGISKTP
jgi:hypothetical protein